MGDFKLDLEGSLAAGKKIRERMAAKGVTQKAVEQATDGALPQGLISRLLDPEGPRPMRRSYVQAFARVLGCTEADLLPDDLVPQVQEVELSENERMMERSRKDFLARHGHDLSDVDRSIIESVRFRLPSGGHLDDQWWWDAVDLWRRGRGGPSRRGGGRRTT